MKALAAFIAGTVLASAGTAYAATAWSHQSNGYWCKTVSSGGIACVPMSAHGYSIGMHRDFVFIRNIDTDKRVFLRYQP